MILPELKNAVSQLKEKKLLISMYEESYEMSREEHPEKNLPSLEEVKAPFLESMDRDGYIAKLDELGHMKSSIDAAYNYLKNHTLGRTIGTYIFYACCAVHDNWCINNRHKYRDPSRADRQWQFLSGKVIPWEELSKDLKYVFIAAEKMENEAFIRTQTRQIFEEHAKHGYLLKSGYNPDNELNRWYRLSGLAKMPEFSESAVKILDGYSGQKVFTHGILEIPETPVDSTAKEIASQMVGSPLAFEEVDDKVVFKKSGVDPTGQEVGLFKISQLHDQIDKLYMDRERTALIEAEKTEKESLLKELSELEREF